MNTIGFREMLSRRQVQVNSLVCVGLDPLLEKMPERFKKLGKSTSDHLYEWMRWVIDETAPYASMYKPQRGHWEAIPEGVPTLRRLVQYIQVAYPEIPIFLDCKRGDIDRTQAQYRYAHFVLDGVHGMNYNGWMGSDTLKALVDPNHLERALVGLGRTSNPMAWHVQDRFLADGRRIWEAMVQDIFEWSVEFGVIENAGVVMGAAHIDPKDNTKIYSEHLVKAREIVGNKLWFLIPGIGTQGGFLEETIKASFWEPGSVAINNSSAIGFDANPGARAQEMQHKIWASGGSCS